MTAGDGWRTLEVSKTANVVELFFLKKLWETGDNPKSRGYRQYKCFVGAIRKPEEREEREGVDIIVAVPQSNIRLQVGAGRELSIKKNRQRRLYEITIPSNVLACELACAIHKNILVPEARSME